MPPGQSPALHARPISKLCERPWVPQNVAQIGQRLPRFGTGPSNIEDGGEGKYIEKNVEKEERTASQIIAPSDGQCQDL